MENLFKFDNPIMAGISKFAKCIFLSLLWLVFCIPIVTIGPATCALYYTVEKTIKNDRDYIAKSFFRAFKINFKQSFIAGVILLVVEIVFLIDVWIMQEVLENGYTFGYTYIFFMTLMVLIALYGVWVIASIARFSNTLRAIMKNSFIIMIRHLWAAIMIAVCLAFAVFIIWLMPITICFMPTVAIWLISVSIERVFSLYGKE